MKILLVEDNKSILMGLEYSLKSEGYEVLICENMKMAKQTLENNSIDFAILDVTLPDGNGYDFFKVLKLKGDIPCIFLTALDEEENIIKGIDLGADDYITKPFKIKELLSRIKNILRRYTKEEINTITVKDVVIDINKMQITKKGKIVVFTSLEYKILLMLVNNINQIITREQILDKIWDEAGNFVNDNTLTVYIKRIREKIEDDPSDSKIIKTIRGIGYKIEV